MDSSLGLPAELSGLGLSFVVFTLSGGCLLDGLVVTKVMLVTLLPPSELGFRALWQVSGLSRFFDALQSSPHLRGGDKGLLRADCYSGGVWNGSSASGCCQRRKRCPCHVSVGVLDGRWTLILEVPSSTLLVHIRESLLNIIDLLLRDESSSVC